MTHDYAALFRTYLGRRLGQMQRVVESEAFVHAPREQERALRLLDYALAEPVAPDATCTLLANMAPKMEMAGQRDEWRAYLLRGIEFSRSANAIFVEAELAYELGVLLQRQSKFAEAEQWLATSESLFKRIEFPFGQAKALNQTAFTAYLQHKYELANQVVHQALTLHQEKTIYATSCTVRGAIALDRRQWHEAEDWHRQALQIYQQVCDQRRSAICLWNLANALRSQNQFTEAIQSYNEAATILQLLGDNYHLAHVHMNLGLAYFHSSQAQNALEQFTKAHAIWEPQQDRLNLAKLFTNLGLVYLSLKNHSAAERSFRESVILYQELCDDAGRLNATDGLAMSLLAQQRFAEAASILAQGIAELPRIMGFPNHSYLLNSMTTHLAEAQQWPKETAATSN